MDSSHMKIENYHTRRIVLAFLDFAPRKFRDSADAQELQQILHFQDDIQLKTAQVHRISSQK